MPPYLANGLVTPRKILDLRSGAGGSVCTAKNQSIDISVILVQRDYCQSDRSPPFHVDFMPRGRLPHPWWRHQMETFSALLAICAGNSPVPGEFTTQRPVTRSFDAFFDLHPNKRLSKHWWGWWFETPPCPLRPITTIIFAQSTEARC